MEVEDIHSILVKHNLLAKVIIGSVIMLVTKTYRVELSHRFSRALLG